ncbi:MAG TPA: flavodoxin domain-containing protein [Candidatus Dormibacteraeota bacterium]|nr:flavodoxin domain-containing protein [Candidatus Dormibacteraeota bacterium]
MNTLVLYESEFGNTKKIAEHIGKSLESRGPVRVSPLGDYSPSFLEGVDLVFVGGPTQAHSMTVNMRHFLDKLHSTPEGIEAVAFDTRVKGPVLLWGSAAKEIDTRLRGSGFQPVAGPESFLVTLGKAPVLHPGEDARAAAWALLVADRARAKVLVPA